MPNTATKDIWQEACQLLGIKDQPNLSVMHLQEFESEAENVLELLTMQKALDLEP